MKNILTIIRGYTWLLIPLIVTFIQLIYFLSIVDSNNSLSITTLIITAGFDSLVAYFIFVFLPVRICKYVIWTPGLLITVFCFANSIYLKAFSDLSFLQSVSLISTIDGIIIKSAVSLLSIRELIIFFLYLIEIGLIYLSPRNKWKNPQPHIRTIYSCIVILFLLSFSFLSIRRAGIYNNAKSLKQTFQAYADSWELQTTNSGYYRMFGFHGYLLRSLFLTFHRDTPLTSEESVEISDILAKRDLIPQKINFYKQRNNHKNLIIIIVESLTSAVLRKHYSDDLLPVLSGLIGDTTTVVALNVQPQVGPGRSSDAQFIYNTGLLPLRREALVEKYASADYPSIAKALSYGSNIEAIGESKSMWRHSLTTLSYGFDAIYDNIADSPQNADQKIFHKALDLIETLPQPFFLLITTLSMHDPYDTSSVDINVLVPKDITDNRDKNYIKATAAFDLWLGEFLEELRQKDVYDNSVIVIASDHEPNQQCLSDSIDGVYIPILILNSGCGLKNERRVKQIDLFPTILNIMGIDSYNSPGLNVKYHGMGVSIMNDISEDSLLNYDISEEKLYGASERLIQSGVFKK